MRRTRTVLDGYDLDVWESAPEDAARPTLLCLHGPGGALEMFPSGAPAPFLQALAQNFRVLVPQHPGYGETERPDWLDDVHDLAYFYLDYLAAAGLQRVHLVGHSLGGWIALELAVRDASRLASLTLASAAGLQVRGAKKGDLFLWSRDEMARRGFRTEAARRDFLASGTAPEDLRAVLRNRETTALLAWEPRLFDPSLHKWLHRIRVPTHVIWAAEDEILPLPYGEAIARAIGGATLSVLPGTGHFMQYDAPAAFSDAVAGFIAERTA